MNRNLLIEIKDTHTNITLSTLSQNKWRVLFQKQYAFRAAVETEEVNFDGTWINEMKTDLKKIISLPEITKTVLVLNTTGTFIRTENKSLSLDFTKNKIKQNIFSDLKKEFKGLSVIGISINKINKNLYKLLQDVSFTYEMISTTFLEEIQSAFEREQITINQVIASHKVNKHALKSYGNSYGFIFNVNIEEKFTVINIFKERKYISSFKQLNGLNIIYANISEKMNISKMSAKKLFKSLGEIPPESVEDNKVIYISKNDDGTEVAYSKKDLSRYITETVNQIFGTIASKLEPLKDLNPAILFSGEISTLKGFETYSKTSLDIESVLVFKMNTVGIATNAALTCKGIFNKLAKEFENEENNKENEIQLNKGKHSTSILRNISGFMDRIAKQFNYI